MQTTTLSLQSDCHQDIDVSMSVVCCANGIQSSATQESVQDASLMTSSDKSPDSKKRTRKAKSSKTSLPDSTSKGKDLTPYWSEYCAEISSQLWLPTVTDLPDSAMNSLSSSFMKTVGSSWYSTTVLLNRQEKKSLQPIYSPSYIASLVEPMAPEVVRTRKIRAKPTAPQKAILKNWFGAARFFYNQAKHRDETLQKAFQPPEGEPQAKFRSENWMGSAKELLQTAPEWAKSVPYQVKKLAVNEFHTALSTNKKRTRQTGKPFEMKWKNKHEKKQCFDVVSSAISSRGIYHTMLGDLYFCEKLPEGQIRDSKFVLENGRYFLCLVYKTTVCRVENQARRVVALDPGVRTFLTGFAEGEAFKLGEQATARISKLCVHLDALMSKIKKASARRRYRLKKAADRMRWKIRDIVDELHWKSIRFLIDNYDLILLPSFETSQMSKKWKRKLSSKSVRNMLTLKHFTFKQRLRNKCLTEGVAFMEVNEAYTSKTASWTGEVIHKLGSAATITSGGVTVDRDINGARGIFLRTLGDTPSLQFQQCA